MLIPLHLDTWNCCSRNCPLICVHGQYFLHSESFVGSTFCPFMNSPPQKSAEVRLQCYHWVSEVGVLYAQVAGMCRCGCNSSGTEILKSPVGLWGNWRQSPSCGQAGVIPCPAQQKGHLQSGEGGWELLKGRTCSAAWRVLNIGAACCDSSGQRGVSGSD